MTTDATREHCVDAETLAAWAERGLPAAEADRVELHLSNCERCQEVLAAFMRSQPHAAVVLPFWSRPAVRLGAAGLAVAASVTLVVWTNRPPAVPAPTATVASSDLVPAAPSLIPAPEIPPAAASAAAPDRTRQAETSKQAEARRAEPASRPTPLPPAVTVSPAAGAAMAAPVAVPFTAPPPPPPAAQAPPPPPVSVTAAAPIVGGTAQQASVPTRPTSIAIPAMAERVSLDSVTIEFVAPDPLASASRMAAGGVPRPARWRILGGTSVQRSVDGGITWTVANLPAAQPFVLTAGSAASQSVCWLVGRDGAVFLTRDGLIFERITFPQRVHLRSVQAIDAQRAVVTTEDGRSFSTSDAGLTWVAGVYGGHGLEPVPHAPG